MEIKKIITKVCPGCKNEWPISKFISGNKYCRSCCAADAYGVT